MVTLRRQAVAAVLALGLCASSVYAHAFLDHSRPKVGSHIKVAPHRVIIWFTEGVEPVFSRIQVFNATGQEVDKKDTHLLHKKHSVLCVSLPKLAAGRYKVVWHAVAEDTHKTNGDFKFWIKTP